MKLLLHSLKHFLYSGLLILNFQNLFAQTQLIGLTSAGGSDNYGTLFHYTPSTNLHVVDVSFPIDANGANPYNTELVEGNNGKCYGMTHSGGANDMGIIFEWDTLTNICTKKFDFNGADNGSNPWASLTEKGGIFYGMTALGGTNDLGVIFEWNPQSNTCTKKIDFSGQANGSLPYGSLVLVGNKFYGMTSAGGINDMGVLFEWDPATNILTRKIDFSGTENGRMPFGSLCYFNNKLYGLTSRGGTFDSGVLFEWDPGSNTYSKKSDFNSSGNGSRPYGSLSAKGGKLYGMTMLGGTSDKGIIFEWDAMTGILTKKVDFNGTGMGGYPYGSLTSFGGNFFGMTSEGGTNGGGIIFEWNPETNEFFNKINFCGIANGWNPYGSLTLSFGKFYGMTSSGGSDSKGIIFEWNPAGNTFLKRIDFSGANFGRYPLGSLTLAGDKTYGMTCLGGGNGKGLIFEWEPNSGTFTRKIDFSGTDNGKFPSGSMTYKDGKLYGMTSWGGVYDMGTIFEWDPVSNIISRKIDFNGTDNGRLPCGSLTLFNGRFYGMTYSGGANDMGIIFEWDPATNILIRKIDFNGSDNGRLPCGTLTAFNGKLYGLTFSGGTKYMGIIFEWDPLTNVFIKKIDFNGSEKGSAPYGSLTLSNGKFYGMTYSGGTSDKGVIFEWDPATNIFTRKIVFDGAEKGSYPYGSLSLSGTKFYGMTSSGGTNDLGVFFDWDPSTNIFTKKTNFNGPNGSNPIYTTLLEYQAPALTGKTIHLHSVFPEGLYNNAGTLRKAHDQAGEHFQGTISDQITVELHDAANYSLITHVVNNVNLSTLGSATFTIPANLGAYYYLTIKHRNSIEITSAEPISFASDTVSYSFDAASRAFGGNLHQMPDGYWVIFGGDINQDGCVDSRDMILVDNSSALFVAGYVAEDVNGDGFINTTDQVLIGNNASSFVSAKTPN